MNNSLHVHAQTTTTTAPASPTDRFPDSFEVISLSSDSIPSSDSILKISSAFQTITKSTIFSIKIIAQSTKSIAVEFDGASIMFQNQSASISFNISFVGNNENGMLPTTFRISNAVFPAGAYLQIWSDYNNNNMNSASSIIMNQIEIVDSHFVCKNPNLGIQFKPCSAYSSVNPLVIPYGAIRSKSELTQRQNSGNARISASLRIEIGTITSSSSPVPVSTSSNKPIFNISILRSQIVFQDNDVTAAGSASGSCALFVVPARRPDEIKKLLASTSAILIKDCAISTNVLGFQPPRPAGPGNNPNLFSNITRYRKESAAMAIGDFTFEYLDFPTSAPNIGNSLAFVSLNIVRTKINAFNAIETVIGIAITNVDISTSSTSSGTINLDFVNARVFSGRSVDFVSFAEGVSIGNVAGPLWNNNKNNANAQSRSSITIQNSEFVTNKTFVDQDSIGYEFQIAIPGSTVSVTFVSVSDFATILFQNISSNTSCGLCTGSAIFLANVSRITNQVAFDQLAITSHVRRGFQNYAVVVQLHFCQKLVFTRLLHYDGNNGVPLSWGWGAHVSGLYYLDMAKNVDLILIDHQESVDYVGANYGPVCMIGLGQFNNCGSIIFKNFKTAYVKSVIGANLFGGKPLLSTNMSLFSIQNVHFVASAALTTMAKHTSAFFNGNSTAQAEVFEVINCSMAVVDIPSSNLISALFVMTGSSGAPYQLGSVRIRNCTVSVEEGKSIFLFSTIQIGANVDALPTAASTEGTTTIEISNVRASGRASMVFFVWCAGASRATPTYGFKDPPMLPTPGVVVPFAWVRQIEISGCHSSLQQSVGLISVGAHINLHGTGIVKLIVTGNTFDDLVGGNHAAAVVPAAVAPPLFGRTFAFVTGTIQHLEASKNMNSQQPKCNKYEGLDVTEKMAETELRASSISFSSIDADGCEGTISHTKTKNNNNIPSTQDISFLSPSKSLSFSTTTSFDVKAASTLNQVLAVGTNVAQSVGIVAVATVSAVSPSLGFGVARQQAMVNFMQNIRDGDCSGISDPNEVPAADSPTQMKIGISDAKFYIGGAVGNTILSIALILAMQIGGTLALKFSGSSSWNRPFDVFARCNVALVGYVCASLLLSPTLTFGLVSVSVSNVENLSVSSKILAIIFSVVFVVPTFYYATWSVILRPNMKLEQYRKLPKKNTKVSFFIRMQNFLFEGEGEWMLHKKSKLNEKLNFDAATPMFEGYNGRAKWFGLIEFVVQVGLALAPFLANLVPVEKSCVTTFSVLIIVLGGYLFLCVWLRPFQERFNRIVIPIVTLCQIGVVVLTYVYAENPPDFIVSLAMATVSLQNAVIVIVLIASFAPLTKHALRAYRKLKRWWSNRKHQKSNRNNRRHVPSLRYLMNEGENDEQELKLRENTRKKNLKNDGGSTENKKCEQTSQNQHQSRTQNKSEIRTSQSKRIPLAEPLRNVSSRRNHNSSNETKRSERDGENTLIRNKDKTSNEDRKNSKRNISTESNNNNLRNSRRDERWKSNGK